MVEAGIWDWRFDFMLSRVVGEGGRSMSRWV